MSLVTASERTPRHTSADMRSTPEVDAFVTRLQSLSPELFNLILDFTLRQDADEVILIDQTWRPPATLQVNQPSR
ncbi:hypothetical protein LTR95_004869 [Oleoguttula sp. CCFEE 5521]